MAVADSSSFITRLREKLAMPLPGIEAQYRMAPSGRKRVTPEDLQPGTFHESAVLILLCRRVSGSLFFPLIERTGYEGVHSAQMALPGGKFDPADGTLEKTARRECMEEIGVGTDCEMLGKLTPLFIPVSRFLVHPFVGYYNYDPEMKPDSREVARVIKTDVDLLADTTAAVSGRVKVGDATLVVPCYHPEGCVVWGATAMILSELAVVISGH